MFHQVQGMIRSSTSSLNASRVIHMRTCLHRVVVAEDFITKSKSESINLHYFSGKMRKKMASRAQFRRSSGRESCRVFSSRSKANREIKFRCHSSTHQQPHQRTPPLGKNDKHPQHLSETQITAPIYPHQRANLAITFAIQYRHILAKSLGLLHEPARRVIIYI
jgi:hypothetical protein